MGTKLHNYLLDLIPPEHRWKIPLLSSWESIIGSLNDKVVLESVGNDSLLLRVVHSTWAHELHLLAPMLKKKVNALLDEPRIKHIRFRVGQITPRTPAPSPQPEKKNEPGFVQLSIDKGDRFAQLSQRERSFLKKRVRNDLQHELASFFVRCKSRTQKKESHETHHTPPGT